MGRLPGRDSGCASCGEECVPYGLVPSGARLMGIYPESTRFRLISEDDFFDIVLIFIRCVRVPRIDPRVVII